MNASLAIVIHERESSDGIVDFITNGATLRPVARNCLIVQALVPVVLVLCYERGRPAGWSLLASGGPTERIVRGLVIGDRRTVVAARIDRQRAYDRDSQKRSDNPTNVRPANGGPPCLESLQARPLQPWPRASRWWSSEATASRSARNPLGRRRLGQGLRARSGRKIGANSEHRWCCRSSTAPPRSSSGGRRTSRSPATSPVGSRSSTSCPTRRSDTR